MRTLARRSTVVGAFLLMAAGAVAATGSSETTHDKTAKPATATKADTPSAQALALRLRAADTNRANAPAVSGAQAASAAPPRPQEPSNAPYESGPQRRFVPWRTSTKQPGTPHSDAAILVTPTPRQAIPVEGATTARPAEGSKDNTARPRRTERWRPVFSVERLRAAAQRLLTGQQPDLKSPTPVPAGQAGGAAGALLPRRPLAKPATIRKPAFESFLTVKFRDALRARAVNGAVQSQAGADLRNVEAVTRQHGLTFEQLIRLPEQKLAALEARAAQNSGVAQPDLASMMIVRGPDERIEEAAQALLRLDEVEWVNFSMLHPEPPCSDLAPPTPNYYAQGLQGYHEPDPGVNMAFAHSLGARGQGIRLSDCEYGWILGTEDLCGVSNEPGQTFHPDIEDLGWDNHGTAVLGELVSLDNAYGCLGLAPDVDAWFYTEWSVEEGPRRVTAITNAIANSDFGDVVVLEMQTINFGDNYGPAELDPAVWTATRTGTDAGVIVVAAAGNGNQNLDAPEYGTYRSWGDSGAIIVGAGTSDTNHNKMSFSTYGSRVNVQGWGENVFTLGYGSYAEHGGDRRQRYTGTFAGTSSATPIVSGCVAVIQSFVEQTYGGRLDPLTMRQLLIDTGIPQGGAGLTGTPDNATSSLEHIGPFPDMEAAIGALLGAGDCFWDNGPFNGDNGLASERNTVVDLATTADDFEINERRILSGVRAVHINVMPPAAADVVIYERDAGTGGPGDVVAELLDRPVAVQNIGEAFGFDLNLLTIDNLAVALDPGTYFLAVRGVGNGPDEGNRSFWATADLNAGTSQGWFRSDYFGFPDWTEVSDILGVPYDFAFCATGYEDICDGSVYHNGHPDLVAGVASERNTTFSLSTVADDFVLLAPTHISEVVAYHFNKADLPLAAVDVLFYEVDPATGAPGTLIAEFSDLSFTSTPVDDWLSISGLLDVNRLEIPVSIVLPEGRYFLAVRGVGNGPAEGNRSFWTTTASRNNSEGWILAPVFGYDDWTRMSDAFGPDWNFAFCVIGEPAQPDCVDYNGPYQGNQVGIASERNTVVDEATVADDFTLTVPTLITGVDATFTMLDSPFSAVDVIIYHYTPSGPGAEVVNLAGWGDFALTDLGEDPFSGLALTQVEVRGLDILLPPGRYFLAVRAVGTGAGRAFWETTASVRGSEGYFRSDFFGFPDWVPISDLTGTPHDFGFCITGLFVPDCVHDNGLWDNVNALASERNTIVDLATTADDVILTDRTRVTGIHAYHANWPGLDLAAADVLFYEVDPGTGGPGALIAEFLDMPVAEHRIIGVFTDAFDLNRLDVEGLDLVLDPGRYYVAVRGVGNGPGEGNRSFWATTPVNAGTSEGWFRSDFFGTPDWTPVSGVLGQPSDFAFCLSGYPLACEGEPLYDNGTFDGANGLASERDTLVTEATTTDDFVVPSDAVLTRVTSQFLVSPPGLGPEGMLAAPDARSLAGLPAGGTAGGTQFTAADVLVFEAKTTGPGAPVAECLDRPFTFRQIGEAFGLPLWEVNVEDLWLPLADGRYFLSVRLVDQGSGRAFWATTRLKNDRGFFRSDYFGYPDWTGTEAIIGTTDFAFCVDGPSQGQAILWDNDNVSRELCGSSERNTAIDIATTADDFTLGTLSVLTRAEATFDLSTFPPNIVAADVEIYEFTGSGPGTLLAEHRDLPVAISPLNDGTGNSAVRISGMHIPLPGGDYFAAIRLVGTGFGQAFWCITDSPKGQSEGYFRSDFFGYPDWVPWSDVIGSPLDFAFTLSGYVPADLDGDGDVDIVDFNTFAGCFQGSGQPVSGDCAKADFDCDGDVDIVDFNTFASSFTGSG